MALCKMPFTAAGKQGCRVQHVATGAKWSASPSLRISRTTFAKVPAATKDQAVAAVQALLDGAGGTRVDISSIQHLVDDLTAVSAAAGLNKVDPFFNNGNFRSVLTTDLRAVSPESETTLGRLSFNIWRPNDCRVRILGSPQFKGAFQDNPKSYIVSTTFQFLDYGLTGVSSAVGEYSEHESDPSMLNIDFKGLRLAPISSDPADLQRWLDLLQPHNPAMDPLTGVVEKTLPKGPRGSLKYMFMGETWQVSLGNLGTVTVAKREDGQQLSPNFGGSTP